VRRGEPRILDKDGQAAVAASPVDGALGAHRAERPPDLELLQGQLVDVPVDDGGGARGPGLAGNDEIVGPDPRGHTGRFRPIERELGLRPRGDRDAQVGLRSRREPGDDRIQVEPLDAGLHCERVAALETAVCRGREARRREREVGRQVAAVQLCLEASSPENDVVE
jgi:hypothetical protein